MADDRIEFRCDTCGKYLRAPASQAGAQTSCPQCGDPVRVPAASWRGGDDRFGTFSSPGEIVCPVCGEVADANAAACPSCGELLGGLGDDPTGMRRGGPTGVTLGSVWFAAFESWKEHFGILLGGLAIAGLVVAAVILTLYIGMFAVMVAMLAGVFGAGGGGGGAGAAMRVVTLLFTAALLGVGSWLTAGLAGLHLEAVRSRPDLGTLFRSPGFWRMLLCGLLLGVFGYALAALPQLAMAMLNFRFGGVGAAGPPDAGMFVLLGLTGLIPLAVNVGMFVLFWPVPFLCVDRPDVGHVKPIWWALKMPAGSWGGHLAVGAAAFGLLLGGLLLCLVGVLLTAPLAGLLLAHAYDRFDRAETDAHGPRALDPEGVI